MWRSSAKLGGMYLRLLRWKKASYSLHHNTTHNSTVQELQWMSQPLVHQLLQHLVIMPCASLQCLKSPCLPCCNVHKHCCAPPQQIAAMIQKGHGGGKYSTAGLSRNQHTHTHLKASTKRSGVKKLPTVGTMRLSLLRRGSDRCSCSRRLPTARSPGRQNFMGCQLAATLLTLHVK